MRDISSVPAHISRIDACSLSDPICEHQADLHSEQSLKLFQTLESDCQQVEHEWVKSAPEGHGHKPLCKNPVPGRKCHSLHSQCAKHDPPLV